MNIQDEAMKIHSKYGTTEKANYEIQLLCEKYAKEYHEQQLKLLTIPPVINCPNCGSNNTTSSGIKPYKHYCRECAEHWN